jgi:hypothetical protein
MRPVVYEFESYAFQPLTEQADQYLRRLGEVEWNQFIVAAQILVTCLRTGRPAAGRSQRVRCSAPGLFELRLNRAGSPGPQRRMLCIREGRRILCVRGFDKSRRGIPRREIEIAVREVEAYRKRADERRRASRARGEGGRRAGR